MTIIVEYHYKDGVAEFALPLSSKIETELFLLTKFNSDKFDNYTCHLDDYIDRSGQHCYFKHDHEFTLNDFRILTVDEYINEIMLYEKQ